MYDSAKGMYEGFIGNSCKALSAAGAVTSSSTHGKVMYNVTNSFNTGLMGLIAQNPTFSTFYTGCAALISAIALAGSPGL